jgi:dynein heavy chain
MRYSYLWAENKNKQIEQFLQSEPYLYEIREKFTEYEKIFLEIYNLPEYYIIGSLRVNMGN